ncbi:MAG: hypothetical protein ACPGC9_02070 [Cytophagales bacterium]
MARFVQPTTYHQLGFIRKVTGLKGMMVVHLDVPSILWNPSSIFFYRHHTYVPYLVDSWEQRGGGAFLVLKDIANRTDAEVFRLMPIFISADEAN